MIPINTKIKLRGSDKLWKILGFYPPPMKNMFSDRVFVLGNKRETIEVKEKDIVKEIKWNLKNTKELVRQ